MEFKDNLRKYRSLARLSQESLADELSVSRQTVSKWENGDTYPSTKHIFMLSKILKCSVDNLINGNFKNHKTSDKKNIRLFYLTGAVATLLAILIGLGFSQKYQNSPIDNSKIAVFDEILSGSFNDALDSLAFDNYTNNEIVGYGVTEGDGTFFVKCNLYRNSSDEPCSAIIYFCDSDEGYSYKCQFLDDPEYVPNGEYYKVG